MTKKIKNSVKRKSIKRKSIKRKSIKRKSIKRKSVKRKSVKRKSIKKSFKKSVKRSIKMSKKKGKGGKQGKEGYSKLLEESDINPPQKGTTEYGDYKEGIDKKTNEAYTCKVSLLEIIADGLKRYVGTLKNLKQKYFVPHNQPSPNLQNLQQTLKDVQEKWKQIENFMDEEIKYSNEHTDKIYIPASFIEYIHHFDDINKITTTEGEINEGKLNNLIQEISAQGAGFSYSPLQAGVLKQEYKKKHKEKKEIALVESNQNVFKIWDIKDVDKLKEKRKKEGLIYESMNIGRNKFDLNGKVIGDMYC